MDELLNVHVSEVGKASGLGKCEGQRLALQVDMPLHPTRQMLRVRFDLFKKFVQDEESRPQNRKKGRRKLVDAFTVQLLRGRRKLCRLSLFMAIFWTNSLSTELFESKPNLFESGRLVLIKHSPVLPPEPCRAIGKR